MKLASPKESWDGQLIVVSNDLNAAAFGPIVKIQVLLDNWDEEAPKAEVIYSAPRATLSRTVLHNRHCNDQRTFLSVPP